MRPIKRAYNSTMQPLHAQIVVCHPYKLQHMRVHHCSPSKLQIAVHMFADAGDADLEGGLASCHQAWGPRVLGWAQLG